MLNITKLKSACGGVPIYMTTYNINSGNGTFNNARGDINITYNYNPDVNTLLNLFDSIKKEINAQELDEDDKEIVIASIENIEDAVKAEKPKGAVIKNAWENIQKIINKAPEFYTKILTLKTSLEQSVPLLEQISGRDLPNLPWQ